MRVLVTVHPALSHVRAMAPPAPAMRRAGHTVAVDQLYNVRRRRVLAIGRSLGEGDVAPPAVEAACREVLGDAGYRERARALQRAVLALPPLDQLVSDVEELVGTQ